MTLNLFSDFIGKKSASQLFIVNGVVAGLCNMLASVCEHL